MISAISGKYTRVEWLKNELDQDIQNIVNDEELRQSIAWYLSYGYSIGLNKDDLIHAIKTDEKLYLTAKSMSDEEIQNGKKPPIFRNGDEVEVILNGKNVHPRIGIICDKIWHSKEKKWFYYISENSKKVGKRYSDNDLKLVKKNRCLEE